MIPTSVQLRLLRELVAEADAVVEGAEHHVEPARQRRFLDEAHAQLVVMIAHEAALAPGLLPGLVVSCGSWTPSSREIALELRRVARG